jgi:hypothetical protein
VFLSKPSLATGRRESEVHCCGNYGAGIEVDELNMDIAVKDFSFIPRS